MGGFLMFLICTLGGAERCRRCESIQGGIPEEFLIEYWIPAFARGTVVVKFRPALEATLVFSPICFLFQCMIARARTSKPSRLLLMGLFLQFAPLKPSRLFFALPSAFSGAPFSESGSLRSG